MTGGFQDLAAEMAVAGAAIRDGDAAGAYVLDQGIRVDHFSTPDLRSLWRFVGHYLDHGKGELTRVVIEATLAAVPDLVESGATIASIMHVAEDAADAPGAEVGASPEHAKRLRDLAERRRVSARLYAAHTELQGEGVPPAQIIRRLAAELDENALDHSPEDDIGDRDGQTMDEIVQEVLDDAEDASPSVFIPTGIRSLDRIIGGVAPGRLLTIAGRPAMGKSVLGLMISREIALNTPGRVLHWSLEMSRFELGQRYIAMTGAATLPALMKQDMSAHARMDWPRLQAVGDEPGGKQLRVLNRRAGVTVDEVVADARRRSDREGVGLLVVDYLGLLEGTDARDDERAKVTKATRRLKRLAQELAIPVVLMAQLNRNANDRANKRPILSDLRDSGSVEQDSDQVILVHRPEEYDSSDRPGEADLIVAKNRIGAKGDAVVNFAGQHVRFENRAGFGAYGSAPSPSDYGVPYPDVPLPGS